MTDTNSDADRALVAIVNPDTWPDDEDPRIGTSLQGYLDVSYAELVQAFGQPGPGDGYKVDAEWTLMFEGAEDGSEPVAATIYNYKTGPNYGDPDALPVEGIRDWHIGGGSRDVVDLVRAAIRKRVPEPEPTLEDADDGSDRDGLLAAAAATMPEVTHEPGLGTIRGYLAALAAAVWDENEGFSGKRPFGNSGWSTDLEAALVQAGVIDGAFNERGYLKHADVKAADRLIRSAAKAMGHPSSPAPVVVSAKHSADRTQEEARAVLARFRDEGLLWLVNTSVLHPRGYALSIGVDDDRQPTGLLGVIDFGEYSCFDIAEIGDTFDRYVRAEITREANRNGHDVPFPEEGDSSDE